MKFVVFVRRKGVRDEKHTRLTRNVLRKAVGRHGEVRDLDVSKCSPTPKPSFLLPGANGAMYMHVYAYASL
jgi:CHAD domain-containing protein